MTARRSRPPPGTSPRLAFGGTFALHIGASGSIAPNLDVFAGLPGAASGRQAVHLTVGPSVRLFIRPQTGSDISLYPDPPGLGSVAGAALQVLPFVLDEVAKLTTPPPAAQAARIVRAVGDALDLRTGAVPKFDAARLNAWAENPAQRFADRPPRARTRRRSPSLPRRSDRCCPRRSPFPRRPAGCCCRPGRSRSRSPRRRSAPPSASTLPACLSRERVAASLAFNGSGLQAFTGTVGPCNHHGQWHGVSPFRRLCRGCKPARRRTHRGRRRARRGRHRRRLRALDACRRKLCARLTLERRRVDRP